jgi:hypothetical protein
MKTGKSRTYSEEASSFAIPFALSNINGVGHSRGAISLGFRTKNFVHLAAAPLDAPLVRVEEENNPKAREATGRADDRKLLKRPLILEDGIDAVEPVLLELSCRADVYDLRDLKRCRANMLGRCRPSSSIALVMT